jgi:hypothetical protein
MHTDETGETVHEEQPKPVADRPEDSPTSADSATHTDENEETVITSTKFVTLHSQGNS